MINLPTILSLLAFIYISPRIEITNVSCKHEGFKLIYENKVSHIDTWSRSKEIDCHFLSSSPEILRYGHDLSTFKSYPILINVWIALFIWIGMYLLIYFNVQIKI
jgi:hypothetical protein